MELSVLEYIIGGLLGVLGIILIVIIMMQQSIRKGLSGAISGGASETFYGKNKRKSKAKVLNRATMILGIVFAALVMALYITHTVASRDDADESSASTSSAQSQVSSESTSSTQSADNTSSAESLYESSN